MPRAVTIAVEGTADAAVARRLLTEARLDHGPEYVRNGKGALDQRLRGYNSAARFSCWLVLRDLDRDATCAPELSAGLLPAPSAHMRFHIAVRAIEAWLLADAVSFSQFFSVAASRVPTRPDELPNPKDALIALGRHSRKKAIREALVPASGTTARVGPGYTVLLTRFARDVWKPEVAATYSDSLARLRRYLRRVSDLKGYGRR